MQIIIKKYLSHIQVKQKKKQQKRSKEQKNTMQNIERLCNSKNKNINFFGDYSSMMFEAKSKANKATK